MFIPMNIGSLDLCQRLIVPRAQNKCHHVHPQDKGCGIGYPCTSLPKLCVVKRTLPLTKALSRRQTFIQAICQCRLCKWHVGDMCVQSQVCSGCATHPERFCGYFAGRSRRKRNAPMVVSGASFGWWCLCCGCRPLGRAKRPVEHSTTALCGGMLLEFGGACLFVAGTKGRIADFPGVPTAQYMALACGWLATMAVWLVCAMGCAVHLCRPPGVGDVEYCPGVWDIMVATLTAGTCLREQIQQTE